MTKKIWRKARKKPVVIEFREIDDHFLEIETREGKLIANKEDDYLIRGVEGEPGAGSCTRVSDWRYSRRGRSDCCRFRSS